MLNGCLGSGVFSVAKDGATPSLKYPVITSIRRVLIIAAIGTIVICSGQNNSSLSLSNGLEKQSWQG